MQLISTVENNRHLQAIIRILHGGGGHCYLVGGCVRDYFLGIPSHNFDLEVFNLPSQGIVSLLKPHYEVDEVGKSYGILKIRGLNIDIGVPRRERKKGSQHNDFDIQEDPFLPVEEAVKRRDFTINAIYFDLKNYKMVDPFSGISDLENRVLRHTSERFSEDPLRVLRGMQFCARFNLIPDPQTIAYCQSLSSEFLSAERIYWEFVKFFLQGVKPSLGLQFLKATGWTVFFPEIHKLIGVEQDPLRHPEGDVFDHTCRVLDVFAQNRTGDVEDDLTLGFTLLCHDFGKPATTFRDNQGIHSYWHEIAGILPAQNFMEHLRVPRNVILQVLTLVQYHVESRRLFKRQASDADFRRLSYNVRRLDLLALVGYCDCAGRTSNNEEIYNWVIERAKALGILKAPPKALIQGRHLIELGLKPDEDFSKLLLRIYFSQLNGDFLTLNEGFDYVRRSILPLELISHFPNAPIS